MNSNKNQTTQIILSLLYCIGTIFMAAYTDVYVNDYNSNRPAAPPLSDLFIDRTPKVPQALWAADVSLILLFIIYNVIQFFHRDRITLMIRYHILVGTIYFFRTCLVWSTTLPDSKGHECIALVNGLEINDLVGTWSYTFQLAKLRAMFALKIVLGLTLPFIQRIHICGDFLFSGHVAQITLLCFLVREYMPSKFQLSLTIISWLLNFIGIFGVLLAHEHYSVDVLIGFFVPAMLCKYHHAMSRIARSQLCWIPGISVLKNPFCQNVSNKFETLADIKQKIIMIIKSRSTNHQEKEDQ